MSAHEHTGSETGPRWARAAVWLPGLAVAVGAAVATAHGLYEVAVAARVPTGIAWIYPLITDGLALVAYAATARLHGSAARYAWTVVIASAGLSGLAQASYLASDTAATGGLAVSPALRFGVGAWPAVAAAVVAHLLYLLAARPAGPETASAAVGADEGERVHAAITVPSRDGTALSGPDRWDSGTGVPPALDGPVIPGPARPVSHADPAPTDPGPDGSSAGAQERARAAAAAHRDRHGALPTVRELQSLADVGRGTAARALQHLRDHTPQAATGLHLVTDEPTDRTQP